MANTRIYAVAGAKGGVGKTTTSINLATSVATRGAKTVVVELDLAMANVADFLALDTGLDDAPTVHEVLADEATVDDAVRDGPGGVDVIPSGVTLDGFTGATVDRLPGLLDPLLDEYDRIVLDTGAGLSRETVVPLALADEVILVSTPRVAAVRDVQKTKQLAERVETSVSGIVFTKSGTGRAPPPPDLADFLAVELLGHVPESAAVPASQDAGEPVVIHAADSEAATAYQRIATTLDKRAVRAASDGERSLELPRLDAIDDRTAAEGPAAADTTDTADAEPHTNGSGSATEGDGWQFGDDSRGPETVPAATPTGIENREGRTLTAVTGEEAASDTDNERASSDGGTIDGVVSDEDLDAPAGTAGENETEPMSDKDFDAPAGTAGETEMESVSDDDLDAPTGTAGENETESVSDPNDDSGSLRERAKSIFGL